MIQPPPCVTVELVCSGWCAVFLFAFIRSAMHVGEDDQFWSHPTKALYDHMFISSTSGISFLKVKFIERITDYHYKQIPKCEHWMSAAPPVRLSGRPCADKCSGSLFSNLTLTDQSSVRSSKLCVLFNNLTPLQTNLQHSPWVVSCVPWFSWCCLYFNVL